MFLQIPDYVRWRDILIAEYETIKPNWSIEGLNILATTKLRDLSLQANDLSELQSLVKEFIISNDLEREKLNG